MPRDTRAIIFDLDDTLYPLESFVLSGFDAVAARLHEMFGIDAGAARGVLRRARANGGRGRELQECLRQFDLPENLVATLIDVMRAHRPEIALDPGVTKTLALLRRRWLIGIVTNGPRDMQARKISALGVAELVREVVYADPVAKPHAAPFLQASGRLGVAPGRTVFVGNDAVCDVYGAWRLGMKTIHVQPQSTFAGHPAQPTALMADACVRSLSEVPDIAEKLVA
jgi:putative hydrolase of the HAD superfamily